MEKKFIHLLTCLLTVIAISSCRQESASPIKNVRFDPGNLNRLQDGSACVNYSYSYGGAEKSLGTVYTKKVLVSFADGLSHEDQLSLIQGFGFVESLGEQTATNSAVLHTLNLVEGLNCKQVEYAIQTLTENPGITYVAPYFLTDINGSLQLLGISNEAIVTIDPNNLEKLEGLAEAHKAEVLMPLGEGVYLVKVDKNSSGNALEVANALAGEESVVHAEPDFVISAN